MTALSLVRQVARGAHPAWSRQRYLMAIAYIDESYDSRPKGERRSDAFAVAAVVSSEVKWARFEREWKKALEFFGIKEFHMADFEGRFGEFDKDEWDNETHRVTFIRRLLKILTKGFTFAALCSTERSPYQSIVAPVLGDDPKSRLYHEEYVFCLHTALEAIVEHARRRLIPLQAGEKISCIADWSHLRGKAEANYRNLLEGQGWDDILARVITFGCSKELLPLQAADLLAYESYKQATNRLIPEKPTYSRRSIQHLVDSGRICGTHHNAEHLRHFAARMQGRLPPDWELWRFLDVSKR